MEENYINQGNKLQKLDYSQLVFLQINRLGFAFTNFYSGDEKMALFSKRFVEQNIKSGLSFLEAMLFWQLSDTDKKEYALEKDEHVNQQISTIGDLRNNESINSGLAAWFDLLMKYLPKTNIMPSKRKTLETLEE